jgi:hypothetical protein
MLNYFSRDFSQFFDANIFLPFTYRGLVLFAVYCITPVRDRLGCMQHCCDGEVAAAVRRTSFHFHPRLVTI